MRGTKMILLYSAVLLTVIAANVVTAALAATIAYQPPSINRDAKKPARFPRINPLAMTLRPLLPSNPPRLGNGGLRHA